MRSCGPLDEAETAVKLGAMNRQARYCTSICCRRLSSRPSGAPRGPRTGGCRASITPHADKRCSLCQHASPNHSLCPEPCLELRETRSAWAWPAHCGRRLSSRPPQRRLSDWRSGARPGKVGQRGTTGLPGARSRTATRQLCHHFPRSGRVPLRAVTRVATDDWGDRSRRLARVLHRYDGADVLHRRCGPYEPDADQVRVSTATGGRDATRDRHSMPRLGGVARPNAG